MSGFIATVAPVLTYPLAMAYLTHTYFLGSGGDGDIFSVLALGANLLFIVSAGVGAFIKSYWSCFFRGKAQPAVQADRP